MLTLQQIAAEAGVSRVVVSRVLNGRDVGASVETRRRIHELVEKYGYQPNGLVQALRAKRTHALGVLLPHVGNTFFARILDGVEQAAVERGWQVLMCQTHSDAAVLERETTMLRQRRVDGMVIAPHFQSAPCLRRLLEIGQKIVLVDDFIPGLGLPCAKSDDVLGARLAVDHLLGLGHTRIAYLGLPDGIKPNAAERWQGYGAALAGRGIEGDPALAAFSESTDISDGHRMTAGLLAAGVRFTAVFATTDHLAIGAIQALREAGLRVPRKVAVVGYGNLLEGVYMAPSLTTVEQKPDASGRRAVELLLDAVEGKTPLAPGVYRTTPELVVRESCGARPAARND